MAYPDSGGGAVADRQLYVCVDQLQDGNRIRDYIENQRYEDIYAGSRLLHGYRTMQLLRLEWQLLDCIGIQ